MVHLAVTDYAYVGHPIESGPVGMAPAGDRGRRDGLAPVR